MAPWWEWRRIRDSNREGVNPNPLSNPEDICGRRFADCVSLVKLVLGDVDGPWRT
jgi:hypothetical protein